MISGFLKGWKHYRKKPVVIMATRLEEELRIETLEGTMIGRKGDYLIQGIKGELYPCKPEVFEATYEPASQNGVFCDKSKEVEQ